MFKDGMAVPVYGNIGSVLPCILNLSEGVNMLKHICILCCLGFVACNRTAMPAGPAVMSPEHRQIYMPNFDAIIRWNSYKLVPNDPSRQDISSYEFTINGKTVGGGSSGGHALLNALLQMPTGSNIIFLAPGYPSFSSAANAPPPWYGNDVSLEKQFESVCESRHLHRFEMYAIEYDNRMRSGEKNEP